MARVAIVPILFQSILELAAGKVRCAPLNAVVEAAGGCRAWKTGGVSLFVLIPGAGADPHVFDLTIDELVLLGQDAIAPALPLDDQAAGPSDHAAAVLGATPGDQDVVIVAQSLGAFAEADPARPDDPQAR